MSLSKFYEIYFALISNSDTRDKYNRVEWLQEVKDYTKLVREPFQLE